MTTNKQNYQEKATSLHYYHRHYPVKMDTYSTLPLDGQSSGSSSMSGSSSLQDNHRSYHSNPSSPTSTTSSTPLPSPSLISSKIGRFNTVSAGQLGKLSRQYQYDSQDGGYFETLSSSPPNRHQFYSLHVTGHQWKKTAFNSSGSYPDQDENDSHSGRKLFQKIGRPYKSVDQSQSLCRSGFCHYDFYSPCVDFYKSIQRGQLFKQQSSTGATAAAQAMEQHIDSPENNFSDDNLSPSLSPLGPSSNQMYLTDQLIIQECAHFKCEFNPILTPHSNLIQQYPNGNHAQGNLKNGWWKIMGQCHDQDIAPMEKFEYFDYGAHYYLYRFSGKEHFNYFGLDDQIGPIAISIRRIKGSKKKNNLSKSIQNFNKYYIIIRSCQLETLRGSISEECITKTSKVKIDTFRPVIEHVAPEIQISCLRQGQYNVECASELLSFDNQLWLTDVYKFGVLYCKKDQTSEEEIYRNCDSSPRFERFLSILGDRITLQGFQGYKGQLDIKNNTTGTESIYTKYYGNQIMYHVSTLLPYNQDCGQQLMRKRHIGNDIVTFIFQENDAPPFSPRIIRSNFQHVFIVVRPVYDASQNLIFKVAVTKACGIADFGPSLPKEGLFTDEDELRDFLLTKAINGENATKRSCKFRYLAMRTRMQYLKDMYGRFSTNLTVDHVPKYGILSPIKQIKVKNDPNIVEDSLGGFAYGVQLDRNKNDKIAMVITASVIHIINIHEMKLIWSIPGQSIMGWFRKDMRIKIFYHHGNSTGLHLLSYQSLSDIDSKLDVISSGHRVYEIKFKLMSPGSHGLHIYPDGIIAKIDEDSMADKSVLRPGFKVIEVCGVPFLSHRYEEVMAHLAYTNDLVLIYLIPSSDSSIYNSENLENRKKYHLFKKFSLKKISEGSKQDLPTNAQALTVAVANDVQNREASDNSSIGSLEEMTMEKLEESELSMGAKNGQNPKDKAKSNPSVPSRDQSKKWLDFRKASNTSKSLDSQDSNHNNKSVLSLGNLIGKRVTVAPLDHDNANAPSSSQSHHPVFLRRELDAFKSSSFEQRSVLKRSRHSDISLSTNNDEGDDYHYDQGYHLRNDQIHRRNVRQLPTSRTEGQIDTLIQEVGQLFSTDKNADNSTSKSFDGTMDEGVRDPTDDKVNRQIMNSIPYQYRHSTDANMTEDFSIYEEREV